MTDPLGADRGSNRGSARVLRGGSLSHLAEDCRSAYRDAGDATRRSTAVGFRLALSPSIESGVKGAKPAGVGTEGAVAEQPLELP